MAVLVANQLDGAPVDLSSVAQYGPLLYANNRYVYCDEIEDEELPPTFADNMRVAVESFDPERDYLLIAGDHLQIAALAAILGARYRWFRVLRWDRQERGYFPVKLCGGAGFLT